MECVSAASSTSTVVSNQLADYVPCNTPITMSITIGQIRLPLHPIDMSQLPSNDPSSTTCVGTIQANPSIDQGKLPGDIILGVPFLRNVYVVHDLGSGDGTSRGPRFGVASLTNATLAATEFQNVRVNKLNPDGSSNGQTGNTVDQPTGDGMKTALKIGISILCFVVVCGALFGVLWWSMRRRLRKERRFAEKFDHARLGSNSHRALLLANGRTNERVKTKDKGGFFQRLFAGKGYRPADNGAAIELTEDELRMRRFEEYKRRQAQEERDSIWSQSTRVRDTLVGDDHGYGHKVGWSVDEFGNPLDLLDEQRGRIMKDETASSGSARSRSRSPGTAAAERVFTRHQHSSRDRELSNMADRDLELDVSQFPSLNQPIRTLSHARIPLAVEPSLSPLTEAADSQLMTPVSTAFQHSMLSYPDAHRPASPEERVGVEDGPGPDFNPFPTPMGSALRPTLNSATPAATPTTQILLDTPASSLRGPPPIRPIRNPNRSLLRAPPEVKSPSTEVDELGISNKPSSTLPLNPNMTPGGHGLAAPPEVSPSSLGASPSQWAPPWSWAVPPPIPAPSAPTMTQFLTPHSVQSLARPLAHGRLPPGAAPPMTRQHSIKLVSPTGSQRSGFDMPLLSSHAFSSPPHSPPADVGSIRTHSATFIPPVSPPGAWVSPPLATGSPTTDPATVNADLLPTSILSPVSSGNHTVSPGNRGSSNPATPILGPPSSSTFPKDGHYPVQQRQPHFS